MELPKNEGGHGIPSLKSTAEKLRLGLRLSLKNNPNIELNNIWMSTHIHNKNLDTILERKNTKPEVYSLLLTNQQEKIGNHLSTLKIQGSLQKNDIYKFHQIVHSNLVEIFRQITGKHFLNS